MNAIKKVLKKKRRLFKDNKGFTLAELLVAIGLFTIIVSIATGGFISSLRTQRQVASLISTQSNISLVLEQMAREIRTGYLFCHDSGVNTPSDRCSDPITSQPCVISDSGYSDPSAPDRLSDGDLPVWTCNAIDYYNAQGSNVDYSLQNGAIMKTDSSDQTQLPQSITGNSVSVKYLSFILFGNVEGDNWTPRVTIVLGIAPSSTDPAVSGDVTSYQTTVSARAIDCDESGNC